MCEFAEETALQLTRREGRIPLCSAVDASKSNIFIITNSTFDFYKITDEVELYESIPWMLIKSVKVKLKTLEIAFRDKKIVFDSSKNDEIFKTIGHILKQMMTEDELSKIGYQRKSLNRVKNSFYGVLLRFQQQASIKGMKITDRIMEKLNEILTFNKTKVELAEFREFTTIFLDVLPLCKSISTIVVNPESVEDLLKYPESLRKTKFIEFSGKFGKKITSFIKSFSFGEKLQGISFTGCDLGKEELQNIAAFCKNIKISSLGFHETIKKDAQKFFYDGFFNEKIAENLTVLNLSGTNGVEVKEIVSKVPNLYALSLAKCNLNIAETINTLSNYELTNMKILDLSENHCYSFPSAGIQLPNTLYSLIADRINWENGTFVNFLNLVLRKLRVKGLKLSLASATASKEEWSRVFKFIEQCKSNNLYALTWDNNPICPQLLSFIRQNTSLSFLSMSGCLTFNDQPFLQSISDSIIQLTSLHFLVLRGSKEKYIGSNIGILLKSLAKSRVVYLDISDNKIGDIGIAQLRQVIMNNRTLQVIAFDGSQASNAHIYLETLDSGAKRKKELNISFPKEDLERLISCGKLSRDNYQTILLSYKKETFFKGKIPQGSPFASPFCIFKHTLSDPFPQIIKDEQIKAIECKVTPSTKVHFAKQPEAVSSSQKRVKRRSHKAESSPKRDEEKTREVASITKEFSPKRDDQKTRETSSLTKETSPKRVEEKTRETTSLTKETSPRKIKIVIEEDDENDFDDRPFFLQQSIADGDDYDSDSSEEETSEEEERKEKEMRKRRIRTKYNRILAENSKAKSVASMSYASYSFYNDRSSFLSKQSSVQDDSFENVLKSITNSSIMLSAQRSQVSSTINSPVREFSSFADGRSQRQRLYRRNKDDLSVSVNSPEKSSKLLFDSMSVSSNLNEEPSPAQFSPSRKVQKVVSSVKVGSSDSE